MSACILIHGDLFHLGYFQQHCFTSLYISLHLFPRWPKVAVDLSHLRGCCMYQAWGGGGVAGGRQRPSQLNLVGCPMVRT